MCDEVAIQSEQIVLPSRRIVNIHVIFGQVYYVYTHSVCVSGCVILSFHHAVDSCICGETIAIILHDGTLLVPAPETLLNRSYRRIARESVGLKSWGSLRRRVAANPSGEFIVVNVTSSTFQIYRYQHEELAFVRSINAGAAGSFQLTGNCPYLWNLRHADDGYAIDVYEAGEFSKVSFRDTPIAQCPLMASNPCVPGPMNTAKFFLTSYQSSDLEGVIISMEGHLSFLTLRSVLIGDLLSGFTRFPYTWLSAMCTVRSPEGLEIYACRSDDRKVVQIGSCTEFRGSIPGTTTVVGKVPFHLRSQQRLHLGVVAKKRALDTQSESDFKIICEPVGTGKVRQIAIDLRKLPRRILTLGEFALGSRASGVPVRSTSSSLGATGIDSAFYISELSTLFASMRSSDEVRCFVNCAGEEPLRASHVAENIYFPDLLAVGMVGRHTLVFNGPRQVELRSTLPPHTRIGEIELPDGFVALGATFGENWTILRGVDQVLAIKAEPGYSIVSLLEDLPVTFISYQNGHIHVGVDVSFARDLAEIERLSEGITTETGFHTTSKRPPAGAVLRIREAPNSLGLESVMYSDQVPTGLYKFDETDGWAIVYGHAGVVGYSKNSEHAEYYQVDRFLEVVGAQGDSFVVRGTGFTAIGPNGRLQRFLDTSKGLRSQPIASATIINSQIVAYVSRDELKFMACKLIDEDHEPVSFKEMSIPVVPSSVHLRMLLIPSQRVLILHGENLCTFYDSVTFDQILVTGMTAAWCDNMSLWRFESNGKAFEHLVVADGRGWVETYSFSRESLTLELDCKYRAAVFDQSMQQRTKELLYSANGSIYLSRGEYLACVRPGFHVAKISTTLKGEVRCISHVQQFLILTTKSDIFVIDSGTLQHFASISISQVLEHCDTGKSNEESVAADADQIPQKEFKNHVAGYVKHGNDACIYILCGIHRKHRNRISVALIRYATNSKVLHPIRYTASAREQGLKAIKADPEYDVDCVTPQASLKLYAVRWDDSIAWLSVEPPKDGEPPSPQVLF